MYRHNLPHWRQDGATYFVTFRLGDALPAEVIKQIGDEQVEWLRSRGITWDPAGKWQQEFETLAGTERRDYYKHFSRKTQACLDTGHGTCILRQPRFGAEVDRALKYFHRQRLWLGDLVIMPNHVHALMTPVSGYELEDILASVKKYCSRRINQLRGQTGQSIWQKEGHDHIARDLDEVKHFRHYIARNPREASLVEGDYIYSRAEWMDVWVM